ncbi:MAG: hypothetical protein ACR2RV_03505 [Verrucomicrobiales bacterium]
MHQPKIRIAPGQLPKTWDRPTVFFANLGSLFFGNRPATLALRKMLGGTLDSYGGRLASILDLLFHSDGSGNLLVIDRPPQPELIRYHSDCLSLVMPEFLIADQLHYDRPENLEVIAASGTEWVDGFVTDPQLKGIADHCGMTCFSSPEGSHLANNKLAFHRELVRIGLPTFPTEIAQDKADLPRCLENLASQGYRFAAIKAQIGASGIGVIRCETHATADIPELIFHEGACLVQGWIEPGIKAVRHIHSPSVQLFVGDSEVTLFDTTDQILDHQSVHEGNLAPPHDPGSLTDEQAQLLNQSKAIAPWLYATGYRGPASIDFHVARRGEAIDIRACEINARVTGATYPSFLARHFQRNGAWLMRNLALPAPLAGSQILDILQDSNSLFSPGAERGCLPINLNTDEAGNITKGQFLFLGPGIDDVSDQLTELVSHPEIKLHYDRD